jgi:RNA polymerase sigma-70 factor, ECF subfamily
MANHDMPADTERVDRFKALYELYYEPILAFALRRGAAGSAADVAAETFLVAWRRLEHVPEDGLPWLYGVARRTLANHRRAVRRHDALAAEAERALRADVAAPADENEFAVMIATLSRLPERDQEVLRLAAWEALNAKEIGRVLGCSVSAARVRLHRARRRLERELAAADTDGALQTPAALRLEEGH